MNVLDEAIIFATEKHSGMVRKMNAVPYITHPMEVAAIVATMTGDINTMAAALLHDTAEDAGVSIDEIEEKFGPAVRALVEGETENKRSDRPAEETWMDRKKESLDILKASKNIEFKKLYLADKLSNMRSFYRSFKVEGISFLNHLHQKDPKIQSWYYSCVLDSLSELKDTFAYKELEQLINYIFG